MYIHYRAGTYEIHASANEKSYPRAHAGSSIDPAKLIAPNFDSQSDVTNAPHGDKGVEVQVESLRNRKQVPHLDIDFHRFRQDVPADAVQSH